MEQLDMSNAEVMELHTTTMEDALKDLYITKRMLLDDGVPDEILDSFIRDRAEYYNGLFREMSIEELKEYIFMKQEEQSREPTFEEKFNEYFRNPEVPSRQEIDTDLIGIIEYKTEILYLAKRSLRDYAEEKDMDMAIRDMASTLTS
jgi:hypothetical protein